MPRPRAGDHDPDHPWWLDAGCQGYDPDYWYPQRGETSVGALLVCDRCPVWRQCLEVGLGEDFGIWGRLRVKDRRELRRRMRADRTLDLFDEADRIARGVRAVIAARVDGQDPADPADQLVLFDEEEWPGRAPDPLL